MGTAGARGRVDANDEQQRYHFGPVSLVGHPSWPDGEPAFGVAPRRKRMDALLVEAAAEAGAEVRQGVAVEELIWEGDRVVGVAAAVTGGVLEERAQLVVGADGFRSRSPPGRARKPTRRSSRKRASITATTRA